MKAYVLFLILAFPIYTRCQSVNIYSKWTATVDEGRTQLILDLTNGYNMSLTRIIFLDEKTQKIDSFGHKRHFNTSFFDLGTKLVWWSGSLERLHESIETLVSFGMIEVVDTNYNGVPSKIKISGDLEQLSLYLDEEDTIEFTRMIYNRETEVEYNYPTRYGGDIIHVDYFDEFGGFSGRSTNIGMKYEAFEVNKHIREKLGKIIVDTINTLRNKKGIESVVNTEDLDAASSDPLEQWYIDAQKKHQILVFDEELNPNNPNHLINTIDYGEFSFVHYPFSCGINAMAIRINSNEIRNKVDFQEYISKHTERIIGAMVSELIQNRGHYQNILNQGYTSTGYHFIAIQASPDDFYINEYAKRVSLKERKEKIYYLMFAQTFSIYENQ